MVNNETFNKFNARFADNVGSASHTRAVCMILVSRMENNGRAVFLHSTGISQQLINRYSNEIYRVDPHIAEASTLDEKETSASVFRFRGFENRNNKAQDELCQYWSIMNGSGIWETATRVRQVSKNLYLVVGLLSDTYRQKIQIGAASSVIGDWLDECEHALFENSVQDKYFSEKNDTEIIENNALLTSREKQVAACLFDGMSNIIIGDRLNLSRHTVENHLRHMYKKLQVHNRTALISKLRKGSD